MGIRICFQANTTLRSLLTNVRPRRDPYDAKGVIYHIPCKDCEKSYFGETGRTLRTRLTEHRRSCTNVEVQRSGLAQHTLEDDHQIDWEESVMIEQEKNCYTKKGQISKFPNFNQLHGSQCQSGLEQPHQQSLAISCIFMHSTLFIHFFFVCFCLPSITAPQVERNGDWSAGDTASQVQVSGVGGRLSCPAHNRALSRCTRGTYFQVVSKQWHKLWLRETY